MGGSILVSDIDTGFSFRFLINFRLKNVANNRAPTERYAEENKTRKSEQKYVAARSSKQVLGPSLDQSIRLLIWSCFEQNNARKQ